MTRKDKKDRPEQRTHTCAGEPEPPSKSERKREAAALKALGARLTELSAEERRDFELPIEIERALHDYQRFPTREARRRQLQFIGKLLRDTDAQKMLDRMDDLDGISAQARHHFHQIEQWRTRLLADPGALSAFIDTHPHVDRQALRQLIKKCERAKTDARRKETSRELFRFLRAVIQA